MQAFVSGAMGATVLLALSSLSVAADFDVDLEGGAAFAGSNTIRIPGDGGTEFSVTDELDPDPAGYGRLQIGWRPGERHTLSLLAAPLRQEASGTFAEAVEFEDVTFASGIPLTVKYRFDTYRLTYRFRLLQSRSLQVGLGFTAAVRDAAITVSTGPLTAEKTNTGFVPLINFLFEWFPAPRTSLIVQGDALAAPQGRAEDVLAAISFEVISGVRMRVGYRIFEGGVDNDEVYNFALIHQAAAGISVTL